MRTVSCCSMALLGGLALLLGGAMPAAAQDPPPTLTGRITGRIEGAPEGAALAGSRVVLIQFRLGAQGVPQGRPIQAQEAGADGAYAFADVPIERQVAYQLGATVGGQVVASQPFTFPGDDRVVMLNLRVPRLVADATALRIAEGLIAVEPRRGAVWITEVLHLVNGGPDVVEGVERPLELRVPHQAEQLEVLRQIQSERGHERVGDKLLVFGNLAPGRTTIAFRYRLPVALGTLVLTQQYPHPVGTLSVLAPLGNLRMGGGGFTQQEPQVIEDTRYDAWAAKEIAAGEPVRVRLSGVPTRQELFLIPVAGFALAMLLVVVWFLRRRLGPAERPHPA